MFDALSDRPAKKKRRRLLEISFVQKKGHIQNYIQNVESTQDQTDDTDVIEQNVLEKFQV